MAGAVWLLFPSRRGERRRRGWLVLGLGFDAGGLASTHPVQPPRTPLHLVFYPLFVTPYHRKPTMTDVALLTAERITAWRTRLQTERQKLAERFARNRDPSSLLKRTTDTIDSIISEAWRALALGDEAAIIAVGGYGRGQQFPYSDIDLLVLLPNAPAESLSSRVTQLIGALWDMGMEVGHSVRTVGECIEEAGNDITVETTLLENRLITGNADYAAALNHALAIHIDPVAFFEAKQFEQQQRHNKYFGVSNNLEPNIKESPGGLRDLQTILWISKAAGLGEGWAGLVARGMLTSTEARLIRQSEKQLERLRIDLHHAARRREDRLIFDLQQQVAQKWGLVDTPAMRASEQLMQLYFRAARVVTQLNGILLPNLKAQLYSQITHVSCEINEQFTTLNGMLAICTPDVFKRNPAAIFDAFLLLQRDPALTGFTPQTLRAMWHARSRINDRFRRDPDNRARFLQLFREPRGLTRTLRRMNLYGVLARYIPAWGKIIGQMQHDLFHVYTVDEHILMVVRNLRRFALPAFNHEYPFCSRLLNDFERPDVLYLAGLFHDIAKGRGGDHSDLGRADARTFCQDHGLLAEDVDLVEWLVGEHLTMSAIAQKEDIYDPDTVARFAERVQTPRRLTALYLLTVADIRGTSPKVWNAWKGKLLEDLFQSTLRVLVRGGALDMESALEERKDEARAQLQLALVPAGVEEKLWKELDTVYFLRHESLEISWHARVLNRFVNSPDPIVRAKLSRSKEGIKVLIYTPDQPDLFARMCGFFGRAQYSIADAKIYTTRHGYALDTFHVFVPQTFDGDYRDLINYIEFELAALLKRQDSLSPPSGSGGRVSRHIKHFPIEPQVSIRPDDRDRYFVLSITTDDRPGLLARIAWTLSRHQVSVQSAKIMTLGERVEDSFLLEGNALRNPKTTRLIEGELLDILQLQR